MATDIEASKKPPGIDERYQRATSTSNLRVEADRSGAGDVIIAAGMSDSRLGMLLLRLHSEWDGAAKPRRVSAAQIKALGLTMPDDKGRPDVLRARREAAAWYAGELRLLAQSLKSRSAALEQLSLWASLKGIPATVVGQALHHWLDHICPACDGHGLRRVPDQPALSARRCHDCHGTGEVTRPDGSTRVLNHIDYVLGVARNSLQRRLRNL